MAFFTTRVGKTLTCVVSATVLAGALTASSGASAHPFWGFGGFGAGLALGAIASSAAQPVYGYDAGYGYGGCYLEHRRFVDSYGNEYVRRVRICN